MARALLVATVVALALCLPSMVSADVPSDLASAGYEVLSADINGDGCADYLIRGKPRIVIIDLDDLMFPIPVPSPSPAALLLSAVPGCQYSQSSAPNAAQLQDPRWVAAPYSVVVGDVLGTSSGSLLIVPTSTANTQTFNLARDVASGQMTLIQTFSLANLYASPGRSAYLERVDEDAQTDLVIRDSSNLIIGVFGAKPDGTFALGQSDKAMLVTLIWRSFTDRLGSTNPADAANYLAPAIRALVLDSITAPDAVPSQYAQQIIRFDVLRVEDDYVHAAVLMNRGSVPTLYFITFAPDATGIWRIFSL
jgi:hypothetical protein